MSLILKGIDLPKCGEIIQIEIYHDGHCSGAKFENNECHEFTFDMRPQAIQILKGHGRIADVGEGQKKMCGECQFKDSDCLNDPSVFCTDRGIFSLAPTILEAEE